MKIIRASVLGFCFGVRRAVELAEKALAENPDKTVYSLGPLIHNENALRALEEKGLHILEEADIAALRREEQNKGAGHWHRPRFLRLHPVGGGSGGHGHRPVRGHA